MNNMAQIFSNFARPSDFIEPPKKQSNNYNFCMPPCLPYDYSPYKYSPQFSGYPGPQLSLPIKDQNLPIEEKKDSLPYLLLHPGLQLMPYPGSLNSMKKLKDEDNIYFKINIDEGYYNDLYSANIK